MELAVLTNLNFVRNSEPTEKFVQVPTRKSLQVMGKSESNLIELVAQQVRQCIDGEKWEQKRLFTNSYSQRCFKSPIILFPGL